MITMHLFFSHELSEEQINDAKTSLKVAEFKALPKDLQTKFSNVPPSLDNLDDYVRDFYEYIDKNAKKGDYMLISGDFGLCFKLVNYAKAKSLKSVYATTKREVLKDENGIKQSIFKHVRFREF